MRNDSQVTQTDSIPFISMVPFLLITFLISWSILALFILLPEPMGRLFGQLSGSHPLFFLAVWAPGIAAFIIISFKSGFRGLRRYLSRVLRWRTSYIWYLFLLVGIPLVFYAGSAWKGTLFSDPFPVTSLRALLPALLLGIIKGPVEEFGWRGFALPLMQRKFAPFWSGLVLGMMWGFWHLLAFMASGTQQSAWSFLPFFIGTITISLIMTALFNDSKGSILLPALMHFQLMNPIWPEAQPYDTYLLTFITVIVVWGHRKTMFSKSGGITEIVPRTECRIIADKDSSVSL